MSELCQERKIFLGQDKEETREQSKVMRPLKKSKSQENVGALPDAEAAGPSAVVGPTDDAGPVVDVKPVIDAGPAVDAGLTDNASPTAAQPSALRAKPAVGALPDAEAAGPSAVVGPTDDAGPVVDVKPVIDAGPAVDAGLTDNASPTAAQPSALRAKPAELSPRIISTGGAPSNLPPLTFHSVHGEDISLSRDGSIAKIVGGYGIAFSARPVKVDEKVCLHFIETPYQWSVLFIFGFTSHDPASLAHLLPVYASDLIDKPGNWAKYGRFNKDNIFDYYISSAGDVHFSINGKDKGLFLTGVDTKNPLWAFVYLFRSGITVQFIDPIYIPSKSMADPLQPLSLHRTKGNNVQFVIHSGIAARINAEIGQSYMFTAQPMHPGQTIIVQVLSTEPAYDGSLCFGLTSCDPSCIRPSDLPANAELLQNCPEYWVVRRDAAKHLGRGDELAVTLTMDGEVKFTRNGSTPVTVMHVDHTVELWAFVDIDGAIQKVRMLTTPQAVTSPPPSEQPGTSAPNNALNAADHHQGLMHASAHYTEGFDHQNEDDEEAFADVINLEEETPNMKETSVKEKKDKIDRSHSFKSQPSTSNNSGRKRSQSQSSDEIVYKKKRNASHRRQPSFKKSSQDDDDTEIESFGSYVVCLLKKLPRNISMILQRDIINLIMNKNLNEASNEMPNKIDMVSNNDGTATQ